MPTIRAYRNEDLDAVIAVFMSAVRVGARRDYTREQLMAWAPDHIDRALWTAQRSRQPTWVAEAQGAVIGFIDLKPDGQIGMLYVHADHQRRGVGSALLGVVEPVAREQGIATLHTEASMTARRFFERRGFAVLASHRVTRHGQTLANFRMSKRLAEPAV